MGETYGKVQEESLSEFAFSRAETVFEHHTSS